jgi:hypothetical protein
MKEYKSIEAMNIDGMQSGQKRECYSRIRTSHLKAAHNERNSWLKCTPVMQEGKLIEVTNSSEIQIRQNSKAWNPIRMSNS